MKIIRAPSRTSLFHKAINLRVENLLSQASPKLSSFLHKTLIRTGRESLNFFQLLPQTHWLARAYIPRLTVHWLISLDRAGASGERTATSSGKSNVNRFHESRDKLGRLVRPGPAVIPGSRRFAASNREILREKPRKFRAKTGEAGRRSVSGNSVERDIEERRKLHGAFCRPSQFVRPDSDKSSQENI